MLHYHLPGLQGCFGIFSQSNDVVYGGLPRIAFFSGISNALRIQGGANICNAF